MECRVKKIDVVQKILHGKKSGQFAASNAGRDKGMAYAPTNIALCKYWGKRDTELNLPVTASLSIALPDKGAMTTLTFTNQAHDTVTLNGSELAADSGFVTRIANYLDLFRAGAAWHLHVDIKMNLPVAAGLASSACGFASIASALNDLYQWQLSLPELSVLARLGSGSAARSLWNGFVLWHEGVREDGMDSVGEPIACEWSTLRVGVLSISENEKPISSRDAMLRTVNSSSLYGCWPRKVAQDLAIFKQAIKGKNFSLLAGTAESNALSMHATMLSSWPPICYYLPETLTAMQHVWELRRQGCEVYFTQDAGPNLKLIFQENNTAKLMQAFPGLEVISVLD
jgi:diphosphomevalonate decarboxylase